MAYIEVKHESKRYKMGETIITANNDINFTADQGKLTVILGPSGAGKSTLLNILGGMDSPTEGEVWIDGTDIATFSDRQLTAFRRHNVGFVFQFYNRALAKNPKLLLCDEPTGALDYRTGKQVLQLLQDASRKDHKTVMIITHNAAIAKMADRIIEINDAQVRSIHDEPQPTPVADIEW